MREDPFATIVEEGQGTAVLHRESTFPKIRANEQGEAELVFEQQLRYQPLKPLGMGAIGEVDLVQDNDIRRAVARKKIRKDKKKDLQVMRFIEEVQIVGQLEHPNIVPIHDVGVDEEGDYFFTMKYVEGETLKQIIQKLKDGDPAAHLTYTFERRTQIFLEILRGVAFAHRAGYIHRDLKPDNIMIGQYGEVMVMDWGSAKKIRKTSSTSEHDAQFLKNAAQTFAHTSNISGDWEDRVFRTQKGALVGTPAYMSPEQAYGLNDELDERSDVYSLCVVFFEFLNLQHYLVNKRTIEELFNGIVSEPAVDSESLSHPHQGPVPRELCFFLREGLQKSRERRFRSVDEMIVILQATTEGRICIHCPSTFFKRAAQELGRYLDNHRVLGVVWIGIALSLMLAGVLQSGFWIWALLT